RPSRPSLHRPAPPLVLPSRRAQRRAPALSRANRRPAGLQSAPATGDCEMNHPAPASVPVPAPVIDLPVPLPHVACLCPTFRRPSFAADAVAQFLLQDYPATHRHLILLDDAGDFEPQAEANWMLLSTPRRFP